MKRRIRVFVALAGFAAAAALASQPAMAHQGGDDRPGCQERHEGHHRGDFRKTLKKLGLSEQQKAQVREQFKSARAEGQPLFKEFMIQKHTLHQLTESGSADEAAIRAQAAKVASAGGDLAVHRARQVKRFLAILTPEQTAKYKEMQAQREERFQKFLTHKPKHGKGAPEEGFDPAAE